MTCGDQVAMPAQHRLGTQQQPNPAQHVAGESVQQGGEHRPVGGGEPYLLAVQLSFEKRDLVAEGDDFGVLGPVTHRQQP